MSARRWSSSARRSPWHCSMPGPWPADVGIFRSPSHLLRAAHSILSSTTERSLMFSFVRNLVGVKTDQAVQSGLEALVKWDPKSATEAELRTMEQHLDELGIQVAQARASYTKEQNE